MILEIVSRHLLSPACSSRGVDEFPAGRSAAFVSLPSCSFGFSDCLHSHNCGCGSTYVEVTADLEFYVLDFLVFFIAVLSRLSFTRRKAKSCSVSLIDILSH